MPKPDPWVLLADLIASLPKCSECEAPATTAFRRGDARWCDDHRMRERMIKSHTSHLDETWIETATDYPRAPAARAAVAALKGHRSKIEWFAGALEKAAETHDPREGLADLLRPIREDHDERHTSAALLEPNCPFCNGDIV